MFAFTIFTIAIALVFVIFLLLTVIIINKIASTHECIKLTPNEEQKFEIIKNNKTH